MSNRSAFITLVALVTLLTPSLALAADGATDPMTNFAKALTFGLAALGGTLAQGRAVAAALEGMCRNPNAGSTAFTPFVLGLALIESLVILAFVVVVMM